MNIAGFGCGLGGRGGGMPSPVLTSLNYTLADLNGGDVITITGKNLSGVTSCTVGGTSATRGVNTSTSLAFTMPVKTAGLYAVQVTTSYGTSNTLSITAFAPTTLSNATGWWRAAYTGAPWVGRIGSRNLTHNDNNPDSALSLGGKSVAGFSAANVAANDGQSLEMADGDSLPFSTFVGTTPTILETGLALISVTSAPTDPGVGERQSGGNIVSADGFWGISVVDQSSTLKFCHYCMNGDGSFTESLVTIPRGSWRLAQWGFDGTDVWVRIGSGSRVNVAFTQNAEVEMDIRPAYVGQLGNDIQTYFNGYLAELIFYNQNQINSDLDKVRQYLECRYQLLPGTLL